MTAAATLLAQYRQRSAYAASIDSAIQQARVNAMLADGQWHYVTSVVDGPTRRWYLDGQQVH